MFSLGKPSHHCPYMQNLWQTAATKLVHNIALVTNKLAEKATQFFRPLKYLIERTIGSIQQAEYDNAMTYNSRKTN